MSKQASVVYSLKDNFTSALRKIRGEQAQFKTDIYNTSKQLQQLYDKKRQLQIDNRAADKAIKDTSKNASRLGKDLQSVLNDNINKKAAAALGLQEVNKKIQEVQKNLNKTGSTIQSVGRMKARPEVSINDKATNALNNIKGLIAGLGVAYGVEKVASGIFSATKYSLELAGNMEQSKIAFSTMLGSEAKGNSFLSNLKGFAIETPYEFNQLQDSAKKMLAYGFKDKDIIPMLTAVGNASAGLGLGADGVDRITIALGQMKAKTKVSADEMRQLTEAGIPAWDMLSKATGRSTAELMKLAEQGVIPADKAIKALLKGMNTRNPDMMIKQSRTLLGLWSSLKDFVNLNIFAAFGEGVRQGILPTFQKFIDGLTKNKKGLDDIQKKLTDVGHTIGSWVAKQAEGLYDYFNKLFNNPDFQKADLPGKIHIVLNDVGNTIKAWFNSQETKTTIKNITKGFIDLLVEGIKDSFTIILPVMVTIGQSLGEGILTGIGEKLRSAIPDPTKGHRMPGWLPAQTPTTIAPNGWVIPQASAKIPGKAFGMKRVPYNNYPVLLHEGEEVRTKQEANNTSRSILIPKLADQIIIREEADVDKIMARFARLIKDASDNMGVVPA